MPDIVKRHLWIWLYSLPFHIEGRSQDFWAWETLFKIFSSRRDPDACCHACLALQSLQVAQHVIIAPKLSIWVVIRFAKASLSLKIVGRTLNLYKSVSPRWHLPGSRIVARGVCESGPKWKDFIGSRANMLEESGHDGKTADNDACRKLGQAPQPKRHDQVTDIGWCCDSPRVRGAHDRCGASAMIQLAWVLG